MDQVVWKHFLSLEIEKKFARRTPLQHHNTRDI